MEWHLNAPHHLPSPETHILSQYAPYLSQPKPQHATPGWLTENSEPRDEVYAFDVDRDEWPDYACHMEGQESSMSDGSFSSSEAISPASQDNLWLPYISPPAAALPHPSFRHSTQRPESCAHAYLPAALRDELGIPDSYKEHYSPHTTALDTEVPPTTSTDWRHTQLLNMVLDEIARQPPSMGMQEEKVLENASRVYGLSPWDQKQFGCGLKAEQMEAGPKELLGIVNGEESGFARGDVVMAPLYVRTTAAAEQGGRLLMDIPISKWALMAYPRTEQWW